MFRYCRSFLFLIIASSGLAAQPPVFSFYDSGTAVADIPLLLQPPDVQTGDTPIHWSLIDAPEGMMIDASTGEMMWNLPIEGKYCPTVCATNDAGSDYLEWFLIVVKNDFENPVIVPTKYIDFVVPADIAQWMQEYRVASYVDACWELMQDVVGYGPLNGRQVIRYDPTRGGGAHSGNPVEAGPFWWKTDPIKGWRLGAWVHEVGHNFHAVTNMAKITNTWAGVFFHHGTEFTQILAKEKMASTPQVFGSKSIYDDFMAWVEYERLSNLDQAQDYIDWLRQGGRAINYTGGGQYKVWSTMCQTLCDLYGTDVLENTVRAVRYDGLPQSIYETADTDLKRNTLMFCIMSNSAGTDLRSYFDEWGFDVDNAFYKQVDPIVEQTISHLVRDEDYHGWKRCSINGHFYTLIPWMIQWHEAERYARRSQGHLVTIRNEEEEQWLSNRFSVKKNIWIGLTDELEEGHWRWTSGEDLEFTNWNTKEPNGRENENYGVFRWGAERGWNDSSGLIRRWALIERDSFPGPDHVYLDNNSSMNQSDSAVFSSIWLSSQRYP